MTEVEAVAEVVVAASVVASGVGSPIVWCSEGRDEVLRVTGDVRNRLVGLAPGERGMLLPRLRAAGLAGMWGEDDWVRLLQREYARKGAWVSGVRVAVGLVPVLLLIIMLSSMTSMLTLVLFLLLPLPPALLGVEGSRLAAGGAVVDAIVAMSGGTGMRDANEPKRLGEGHCRLHRVMAVAGRWLPRLASTECPAAGLSQL